MKDTLLVLTMLGSLTVGLIACKEQSIVDETPLQKTSASAKEAASSTAQGIMANLNVSNVVITEEVTYTFDTDAAKNSYSTSAPYNLTIVTGTGAPQPTPAAPSANEISNSVLNQDKCVFFNGGDLPDFTYTQTINGSRGWKWTWTYAVTGAVVAPKTAWDTQGAISGVDPEVPIDATIAGLSALSSKQHSLKYSFGLQDNLGASRITNLKITVDGTPYTPGQSIQNGIDFTYASNAGTFGNVGLLLGTDGINASAILLGDSFAGNDALSNVVYSKVDQIKPTLGAGNHTIVLTATVKGNEGTASTTVSVTKNVTINGGCN